MLSRIGLLGFFCQWLAWRSELDDIGRTVRNMVSFGIMITASIITLTVYYVVGLNGLLSALFGSMMVVTGPIVIMPMFYVLHV